MAYFPKGLDNPSLYHPHCGQMGLQKNKQAVLRPSTSQQTLAHGHNTALDFTINR